MLLTTLVGEVVAIPAAKVCATGRKIKLSHPPSAGSAVDHQRANEPVSLTAKIAGRGHQFNLGVQG